MPLYIMKLRKLNIDDAEWMLEWMHDDNVVHDLSTDFSQKTIEDCLVFIDKSLYDKENLNLAIVDDNDVYMGTVSLKHINTRNCCAEFAITVRRTAMGKGFSIYGMNTILELGKKELGLNTIYWCVSKKNIRALRFYQKHEFETCSEIPVDFEQFYHGEILDDLVWFFVRL